MSAVHLCKWTQNRQWWWWWWWRASHSFSVTTELLTNIQCQVLYTTFNQFLSWSVSAFPEEVLDAPFWGLAPIICVYQCKNTVWMPVSPYCHVKCGILSNMWERLPLPHTAASKLIVPVLWIDVCVVYCRHAVGGRLLPWDGRSLSHHQCFGSIPC